MRGTALNRTTRRRFLKYAVAAGTALSLPSLAIAQDDFERRRALRNLDRSGNTLAALEAIDANEPILSGDTAYSLQLAIMEYERIAAAGGWGELPRETYGLIGGAESRVVSRLRDRLAVSGDFVGEMSRKDIFDDALDSALRHFQARHGLILSGKVDEETFYALNTPVEYRLQQLKLNAIRVEALSGSLSDRYVVVNIPAASIEAIEESQVVQRHNAVVGRIDRQTPILQSKIHEINFNPYWHVPKSIIQKDIITYMNEDPNYLANYNIKIYDSAGSELDPLQIDWTTDEAVNYAFRQEPGAENAMGHVKINFYNPHSVYLHDTPTKSLFGENRRFHSSGCVRVDNVEQFVAWILRFNEDWDPIAIQAVFATNDRVDVAVANPAPILTTYISAWANRLGTVSFRDDVYEYDRFGVVDFASI